jgi:hypothetical protein
MFCPMTGWECVPLDQTTVWVPLLYDCVAKLYARMSPAGFSPQCTMSCWLPELMSTPTVQTVMSGPTWATAKPLVSAVTRIAVDPWSIVFI